VPLETPRHRHRREAIERPFGDGWRALLAERWPIWNNLDDDERRRLEDLVKGFLVDKRWEAAQGFDLTDEVRLLIAAQACLLILGLDHDSYRHVGSIIVHPTTIVLTSERAIGGGIVSSGPFPIVGQSVHRGPVLIAWDEATRDARHPERGHNVVFHEFAHKLDMLDGTVDGTPPLLDDATRAHWIAVCTHEYQRLRSGDGGPLLRDYAGTNPGEFFAVVTEVFFTRPVELRDDKPELYDVLAGFYRQDPASRHAPR
jgi:hypothetical protein